nr:MAG TPA: hypothetical protein [Caudoviricetes sp.]
MAIGDSRHAPNIEAMKNDEFYRRGGHLMNYENKLDAYLKAPKYSTYMLGPTEVTEIPQRKETLQSYLNMFSDLNTRKEAWSPSGGKPITSRQEADNVFETWDKLHQYFKGLSDQLQVNKFSNIQRYLEILERMIKNVNFINLLQNMDPNTNIGINTDEFNFIVNAANDVTATPSDVFAWLVTDADLSEYMVKTLGAVGMSSLGDTTDLVRKVLQHLRDKQTKADAEISIINEFINCGLLNEDKRLEVRINQDGDVGSYIKFLATNYRNNPEQWGEYAPYVSHHLNTGQLPQFQAAKFADGTDPYGWMSQPATTQASGTYSVPISGGATNAVIYDPNAQGPIVVNANQQLATMYPNSGSAPVTYSTNQQINQAVQSQATSVVSTAPVNNGYYRDAPNQVTTGNGTGYVNPAAAAWNKMQAQQAGINTNPQPTTSSNDNLLTLGGGNNPLGAFGAPAGAAPIAQAPVTTQPVMNQAVAVQVPKVIYPKTKLDNQTPDQLIVNAQMAPSYLGSDGISYTQVDPTHVVTTEYFNHKKRYWTDQVYKATYDQFLATMGINPNSTIIPMPQAPTFQQQAVQVFGQPTAPVNNGGYGVGTQVTFGASNDPMAYANGGAPLPPGNYTYTATTRPGEQEFISPNEYLARQRAADQYQAQITGRPIMQDSSIKVALPTYDGADVNYVDVTPGVANGHAFSLPGFTNPVIM